MTALDEIEFLDAAITVASWKRPLLISHVKPDGDALGSLAAMRGLLRRQGIEATALLFDVIPSRYALFSRYEAMPVLGRDISTTDLAGVDGVVILDTCAYGQLDPIADWLRSAKVGKLAVDHHITRDDLADAYLIDQSSAATCLILYDWARTARWALTLEVREALFVGMAMDTGWFRHSNTDDRVLAAAAELVGSGVRAHDLYQQLYLSESLARVRLLGAALGSLELLAGDRIAVMTLPAEVFAGCGAMNTDTEDIVNEPLRIGSVVVSVLLVHEDDGLIRVSLRSKPPSEPRVSGPANRDRATRRATAPSAPGEAPRLDIDVAKIAEAFGGGGHARAAGARVSGTLPEVRRRIMDRLQGIVT